MTVYLRFPDEETFRALVPLGAEFDGETVVPLPSGIAALSVVGTLLLGGEYDERGGVLVPPVVLPGWHVNVIGNLPLGWLPYEVVPGSPRRVFGGSA